MSHKKADKHCYESDTSSNDGKRRRDQEEDDIAGRSKKTFRTPEKPKRGNMEDDIGELKQMMRTIMTDTKDIKKEQQEYRREISTLKEENRKLCERIERIEKKFEQIEKRNKKENIVIKGLNMEQDTGKAIDELLREKLGVEVRTKVIGQFTTRRNENIVKVKMESFDDKLKVMKNKYKLKGTNIYVDGDMDQRERKIQAEIRTKARLEKQKGEDVKVAFQKLIINGTVWKWNEITEQLERSEIPETQQRTKN